jgi:hypothetical protein
MKAKFLFPALFAAMCMLNSCDKKEEAPKPVEKTYTPTVTAKVDNKPWTGVQGGANNNTFLDAFVFQASDAAGSTIKFMAADQIHSVGTYTNLVGQYIVPTSQIDATLYTSDFGGTAQFVITKMDTDAHRISGTFSIKAPKYSGVGADSVVITDGVFSDVLFQ